jgi:serine/threonine-protein kinase
MAGSVPMIAPGSRLGPYELLSPLGKGGMGEVYRAKDLKLGREVAIKILPDQFASDPERLARFQREAQVLASLNHPNIAAIYGLEESDGTKALVLELVPGETLADRIARGPIRLDEALPIAKQIAEALEAAHEQGIIHRDLKPANIKITPDGVVKVLDFGLAKLAAPTGASSASNLSMSPTITSPAMVTGVGVLLGTAAYMSPEQAKGREADKRSDVWAFGCVLYEMLTGKRAFDGEDVAETLASVLRGDPNFQRLPPHTPSQIVELIRRCLTKDRAERLPAIAAAQLLLTWIPPIASSPTRSRITGLILGAATVTAAVIALIAYALWPAEQPVAVTKLSLTLPEGQGFTGTGRHFMDVSADGRLIVYIANNRLYLRPLAVWEGTEIAGADDPLGLLDPVFSPDGRSIAFFANSEKTLKKIPAAGGAPISLATLGELPFGISWDADGLLVGQGLKGVWRVPVTGSGAQQVVKVGANESAFQPSMLPGGEWVLMTVAKITDSNTRWDEAQVIAQSLRTGERRVLVTGGSDARYVSAGYLIYANQGSLFAVPFDPKRLTVGGSALPVVVGVRRPNALTTGAASYAISANGTLLYIPGPARLDLGAKTFVIADPSGMSTSLPILPGDYDYPRLTPDGKRLAYTQEESDADVWTFDLTRSDPPLRLTFEGHTRFPVWTHDGRQLAVQSEQGGSAGIFLKTLGTATADRRLTTAAAGEAHIPESISRDDWLLFSILKNGKYALWMVRLDGSELKPFDDVESADPLGAVFSPDGRWVAYADNDVGGGVPSRNRGIYIEPFPPTTAKIQVTKTANDYHPTWAADGKSLNYIPSAANPPVGVPFFPDGRIGQPRRIGSMTATNFISSAHRSYDVLPDGRFLMLRNTGSATLPTAMRVVQGWFSELQRLVPKN